jgi:TPR repeat protein
MYRKGVCVEQSDMNAFQWFQRSAENGYAPAQFSLGNYYESDLVGKKDMNAAYDWKLKAAHQGYIEVDGELRGPSCNKNENVSGVDMFGGPY